MTLSTSIDRRVPPVYPEGNPLCIVKVEESLMHVADAEKPCRFEFARHGPLLTSSTIVEGKYI